MNKIKEKEKDYLEDKYPGRLMKKAERHKEIPLSEAKKYLK